jgi:serine/threonine protein kinase
MEYFPLGDLQSFLNDAPNPLAEPEVQQITFQILEGLKFMHDNGFAHRDIKPAVSLTISASKLYMLILLEHPRPVSATARLVDQNQRLRN